MSARVLTPSQNFFLTFLKVGFGTIFCVSVITMLFEKMKYVSMSMS